MNYWKSIINPDLACWDGYHELLGALPADVFPDAGALNSCLPAGLCNRKGSPIRFLPSAELAGVDYERHIFETGQVSTRENNWHDLFNALVWCRLPQTKVAMNALHYEHLGHEKTGHRGKLRDALTLLDESGLIVAGSDINLLDALANRDWHSAFVTHRSGWDKQTRVLVCGHAILEKFLKPYKSVTAHALLLHTPELPGHGEIDPLVGPALDKPGWCDAPAALSPLPLMGIPGWWTAGEQDQLFYDDRDVFRPVIRRRSPAPVHLC